MGKDKGSDKRGEQMNGKPSNRKKKPTTTIATIDGVKLTAAELTAGLVRQIEYKLMTFAYFVVGDLIAILDLLHCLQQSRKGTTRRHHNRTSAYTKGLGSFSD